MNIVLVIGGESKTFSPPFISGRMLKETISMSNSEQIKVVDGTLIDTMAEYIVKIYGHKFTEDELLDGIASSALIPTFQATIEGVTGKLNGKLEKLQDPNVKRGNRK